MTRNLLKMALAVTFLVRPAIAQDSVYDTDTTIISIRGLDLSNAADIRALDMRLGRAIAEVCGTGSPADPERQRHMLACRHDVEARVSVERASAIAAARPSADSEMLAAQRH